MNHVSHQHWDVFCKLVDNFGDIGVCWRLARLLARLPERRVRLWTDSPEVFWFLNPGVTAMPLPCVLEGVMIDHWARADSVSDCADVVIEAFACELPDAYLQRMAARPHAPWWLNLEYLSAESWVGECHGMRSPHPRLPLLKHFFFPGFEPRTGGLMREPGLVSERDTFQSDRGEIEAFLHGLGCGAAPPDTLRVSLFCYHNPALPMLLESWFNASRPIQLLVPEGIVLNELRRLLACPRLVPGGLHQFGSVTVVPVSFLSHADYDRLLWACDLNFVRGEDSFVRAQWAARPFVWQIYPQSEDAHLLKLKAFLARFIEHSGCGSSTQLEPFWLTWNGVLAERLDWDGFEQQLSETGAACQRWSTYLQTQQDLLSSLVSFVEKGL